MDQPRATIGQDDLALTLTDSDYGIRDCWGLYASGHCLSFKVQRASINVLQSLKHIESSKVC
jgi:hypothetical protein